MHQKRAALSSSITSPTYVHLGMSLWHHQLFPLYLLISTHMLLCCNFSHIKKKNNKHFHVVPMYPYNYQFPTSLLSFTTQLLKRTASCYLLAFLFFHCRLKAFSAALFPHVSLEIALKGWAALVAQRIKHLPAMQENWVWPLGWEDPLEKDWSPCCCNSLSSSYLSSQQDLRSIWVLPSWYTFFSCFHFLLVSPTTSLITRLFAGSFSAIALLDVCLPRAWFLGCFSFSTLTLLLISSSLMTFSMD